MAEQEDLLAILVITIMNAIFLIVFVKWVFPDIIKTLKEIRIE